ncbi:hypothetical protein V8E54_007531 [Elaphomyces granulatus]
MRKLSRRSETRREPGEQYEDAQYKRATRCLPISTGIGPDIYTDWSRDGWKKQEKLEMDEDDGLESLIMNTDFTTTAKKAQAITRRPSILVHMV